MSCLCGNARSQETLNSASRSILILCLHVHTPTHKHTLEARGKPLGMSSRLLPLGSGMYLGPQLWWQASLSTEPTCLPCKYPYYIIIFTWSWQFHTSQKYIIYSAKNKTISLESGSFFLYMSTGPVLASSHVTLQTAMCSRSQKSSVTTHRSAFMQCGI